jgi:hypothetical protein
MEYGFEFACPVPAVGGEVALRIGPDGVLVLSLRRDGEPGCASIPLERWQAKGLAGGLEMAIGILEALERRGVWAARRAFDVPGPVPPAASPSAETAPRASSLGR